MKNHESEFSRWLIVVIFAVTNTLRVSGEGLDTIRQYLPAYFNWSFFCVALALMSAFILRQLYFLRQTPQNPKPTTVQQSADCA